MPCSAYVGNAARKSHIKSPNWPKPFTPWVCQMI
jgi:hypothetical protein